MKYGRMDLEDSVQFSKVNDTILSHINEQLRDTNSRNFVCYAATGKVEERIDLMTNDFNSQNSTSSKGRNVVLNRKYVSVRNDREEIKNKMNSQDE